MKSSKPKLKPKSPSNNRKSGIKKGGGDCEDIFSTNPKISHDTYNRLLDNIDVIRNCYSARFPDKDFSKAETRDDMWYEAQCRNNTDDNPYEIPCNAIKRTQLKVKCSNIMNEFQQKDCFEKLSKINVDESAGGKRTVSKTKTITPKTKTPKTKTTTPKAKTITTPKTKTPKTKIKVNIINILL